MYGCVSGGLEVWATNPTANHLRCVPGSWLLVPEPSGTAQGAVAVCRRGWAIGNLHNAHRRAPVANTTPSPHLPNAGSHSLFFSTSFTEHDLLDMCQLFQDQLLLPHEQRILVASSEQKQKQKQNLQTCLSHLPTRMFTA